MCNLMFGCWVFFKLLIKRGIFIEIRNAFFLFKTVNSSRSGAKNCDQFCQKL